MVRAMQARSPAGEVFYLTRIAGERTELYGEAQSFIDRTFIMVVGARDHGALLDFYGTKLGNELTPTSEFPITVLSRAYDFPIETTYELASVRLKDKFSIEMDHYPDEATPRPQRDGELPPGIAMVSFGVESLDDLNLEWRAAPREIEAAPYDGRRSAVAVGPAGEWLENRRGCRLAAWPEIETALCKRESGVNMSDDSLAVGGIYEFVFGSAAERRQQVLDYWARLGFQPIQEGNLSSNDA